MCSMSSVCDMNELYEMMLSVKMFVASSSFCQILCLFLCFFCILGAVLNSRLISISLSFHYVLSLPVVMKRLQQQYRLKKGCAYHLDLFVVGILNGFLSIYGFPWMHGVLPHSPLHLRSLADVEERVDGGHVYEM